MKGRLYLAPLGLLVVAPVQAQTSTAQGAAQGTAAQTADAQSAAGTGIADIVVTAQKRAENLQSVPLAVSAFSGNALQNRAVSSLVDIQTLVPSVNIQPQFAAGVVTIRGIGFAVINAGAESSVALHVDGVYMSRPAAALAGLYDVQRIEVARGPQGTLYGRNSTGGAINIVTNKPTSDWSGEARLTLGNYNEQALELAIGGPIIPDKLSFRVSGKIERRDGYDLNLFNGKHVEDLDTNAARAQLLLTPDERFSLLISADIFKENDSAFVFHYAGPANGTVCNASCGVNRGGTVPDDIRDVDQNTPPVNRRNYKGLMATAKEKLSDAITLSSITGYRRTNSYFNADLDATSVYLTDVGRLERAKQFSEEAQVSLETRKFTGILGGYYFYENVLGQGTSVFNKALLPFSYFCQCGTLRTHAAAGFGQLTFHATDALSFTVGGRYSHETKQVLDEVLIFRPNPDTRRPASSPSKLSFNSFTPKFAAEYKFGAGKMIYANIQRGFKSGGFALGSVTPGFQPETVWSYEAGIKATWFDGMLRTNLAGFHYDYSNLQVGFVQGLTPVIQNAASARIDGAEFEIAFTPVKPLRLEAIGSYLDTRFVKYSTADNSRPQLGILNLAGNQLSQAPKFSGTFAATYTVPVADGALDLRGEAFVSSRVYFSPFNTDVNSQARYHLFNAFATWKRGKLSIGAYARNLTNKTYLVGASVASPLVGTTLNVTLGAPRTFGGTVGYSF